MWFFIAYMWLQWVHCTWLGEIIFMAKYMKFLKYQLYFINEKYVHICGILTSQPLEVENMYRIKHECGTSQPTYNIVSVFYLLTYINASRRFWHFLKWIETSESIIQFKIWFLYYDIISYLRRLKQMDGLAGKVQTCVT